MDQFIYTKGWWDGPVHLQQKGWWDGSVHLHKKGCWYGLVHLYQGVVGWTSSFI